MVPWDDSSIRPLPQEEPGAFLNFAGPFSCPLIERLMEVAIDQAADWIMGPR
jgi:hypothetical protein